MSNFSFNQPAFKAFKDYLGQMISDGRVITICKDGEPYGILAFSLCDNYEPYWKKKTWEYRSQQADGRTVYIEFLAAKHWDKEIRQKFQEEILKLHPQIERAIWHKWATWGDRKVIWRRQWVTK